MSWIELHQSAPRHPKVLLLAHTMDVTPMAALGACCTLWLWSLDYAEDGDLSRHPPEVIAQAVGFPREDGGRFWSALLSARLRDEDGRIHDWEDYVGRLLASRAKNRRRAKKAYAQSTRRTPVETPQSAGLPTNQPTNQNQPTGISSPATAPAALGKSPAWIEFVAEWNRFECWAHIDPKATNETRKKSWGARCKDAWFRGHWVDGINRAARTPGLLGQNPGFAWIITPDWFLRPGNLAKILDGSCDSWGVAKGNGRPAGVPPAEIWKQAEDAERASAQKDIP